MAKNLLTADDIANLKSPKPDHRIKYGISSLQFGDLRLPKGDVPHSVIIVVHGGCWQKEYNIKHIGQFADAVRNLGYATWTIEYRRVGNKGGGWPGSFLDIGNGVDHLRQIRKKFNLNLEKVFTLGHSSGGHFGLWLGARNRIDKESPLYFKNPLKISGVLSIAGVPNLSKAYAEKVCGGVVEKLMGGSPEEFPQRYQAATPNLLVPLKIPQTIICGRHDKYISFSEDYIKSAKAAGDNVKKVIIDNTGHFESLVPASYPHVWEIIKDEIERITH